MTADAEMCSHGKKWADECADCERVWGHSFLTDEQKTLAKFYNVNTKDELISAQQHHIDKLQQKVNDRWATQAAVTRVREG